MATYCTTTNVRTLNPDRVYNTSSKPTLVQLTSCIAWITADMDMRMANVNISVPISTSPATSTNRLLRMICGLGSAGLVEESAFMGGNRNESEHANTLTARYESYMQKIEENPSIILGGGDATFDSYEYSNSDKKRDEGDDLVIRDEDNW